VQPLIDRLKDASTKAAARQVIILCLAEMPVPAAVQALSERLFDNKEEVRVAAASALRGFPTSAAFSEVRNHLRDTLDQSDVKAVQHAAEAIGELRDTLAVPQLIELLDHRDPLVVDAVGRALQTITKQDFGRSRFRWGGWWRRHQTEPRLQWLLAGLCHPSAIIRLAAQDELCELSGDVASYRYDQPRRERDLAARRWVDWWQSHGYEVV
jgi:HEAT repeat protein